MPLLMLISTLLTLLIVQFISMRAFIECHARQAYLHLGLDYLYFCIECWCFTLHHVPTPSIIVGCRIIFCPTYYRITVWPTSSPVSRMIFRNADWLGNLRISLSFRNQRFVLMVEGWGRLGRGEGGCLSIIRDICPLNTTVVPILHTDQGAAWKRSSYLTV